MTNNPQQVTSRYARNLLSKGKNNDFVLINLLQDYSMVDQLNIGTYYKAAIQQRGGITEIAVGVTPEQAITRCLEKHGVTFR